MVLTPQQATGKKLGSYELVREVCASSVGATYVARDVGAADAGHVQLTKVHRHVAKSPQLCDNFLNAAKKAVTLEHPAVARVVDSGTVDGELFVAFEHHEGDSLASLLRRVGPEGLPLPIAERILLDVFDAIRAAHEKGAKLGHGELGHGELGPWCVHIGQDGKSRVSGFAVDRALTRFGLHYAKNLERLTYAAPERVKAMSLTLGPAPAVPDLRADTFSAAVIAWELFTRQRLFASRMEAAVIQKVLASAIPDPKGQRAELSEVVSRALVSALNRAVGERASADELARAIDTGEAADHAAVADFASRQIDKSQARAMPSSAPRAFNSVRPPPMAPAVIKPKASNGSPAPPEVAVNDEPTAVHMPTPGDGRPKSVPPAPKPVRTRAKTLMGFAAAPMTAPIEEETTTLEQPRPPVATPTAAAAPAAPIIEDESTSIDDLLVEEVTAAPAPARPPPPPVPGRRPPPKSRQQTLLGVEPLQDADSTLVDVPSAAANAPAGPVPASPAAPPAENPNPEAPKPGATTLTGTAKLDPEPPRSAPATVAPAKKTGMGFDLDTGSIIGTPPAAYELLCPIARGGMATVWAARRAGDESLDHIVAIKTLLPELSDDDDFEAMFLDEMRVAAKIKHPNVAEILEVAEGDGRMYIVMEWVDGETFGGVQQSARSTGGVPLNLLLRMASDVCAGLHAAHELRDRSGNSLDLVHRDINPSNILVARDGKSKVVDFGIAKSKGRMHVTRAGSTVKGKAPYLSPEQIGGLPIDRRSDLFSLGVLLYVMATGVHPFRADTELKTIENVVLKAPEPLRTIVPDIHPEFDALVLRLLEKDAKKRLASAAEVADELDRIAALVGTPATHGDVGAFVERIASDVLATRRNDLLAAVGKGPAAATPAPGLFETVPLDPLALAATPAPSAAEEPAVSPFQGSDEPTVPEGPPSAGASAEALPPAPFPEPPADLVDSAPIEPARRSPWTRLIFLIVVGVAVGIGVIALIEVTRDKTPEPETQASATAATATAKATQAPAIVPTATTTIEVEPPPPATESATAEVSASASESAAAEPTAPETSAPTTKPPPRPLPPRPKPPGTAKPPKYNPTGI